VGQDPETVRQPRQLGRGFFTSLMIHSGLLFPLITLAFVLVTMTLGDIPTSSFAKARVFSGSPPPQR